MNLSDFAKRADEIIKLGRSAADTSGSAPYGGSNLDEESFMEFRAAGLSFLRSVFGVDHPYYTTFDSQVEHAVESCARSGLGILAAAKQEVLGGWTQTLTGIVSAVIFADFLEMAEYLLASEYKDAAAVIIGGVLEEHLRQLCRKHGIMVLQAGSTKPKAANLLNAELVGQKVYSVLDQKAVTTWLDLRNKAAHGNYKEYTREQVDLMLQGVQNFAVRNPL